MLPFFCARKPVGHTVYRNGLLSQTHGASRLKQLLLQQCSDLISDIQGDYIQPIILKCTILFK